MYPFATSSEIAATLTLHHTDPEICTDALHGFIHEMDDPTSSDSEERNRPHWSLRAQAALSNVFVKQQKWRMALQCLDKGLTTLDNVASVSYSALDNLIRLGLKIELISRQGRILLQIGAVDEAQELFHTVESTHFAVLSQQMRTHPLPTEVKSLLRQMPMRNAYTNIILNKGLLFFAREQYPRAMEQFNLAVEESRAVNSERDTILGGGNSQEDQQQRVLNQMALTQDICMVSLNDSKDDNLLHLLLLDPPEDQCSHLSTCVNNMALCALYSCQMRKAVHILESLIRENPSMHMTEVLTFNLCTLYELGSDNAKSGKKKRTLQLIATRFGLQDIPQESFRIG
jgi:tetratricopeptide (TPR) repeat protein